MLQKSMQQHVDRLKAFDEDSISQLTQITNLFHDISKSLQMFKCDKASDSADGDTLHCVSAAAAVQCSVIDKAQQYFFNLSKAIADTVDGSIDTLKSLKKNKMEEHINNLNFAIEKLNEIDKVMERLEGKHTSTIQKFGKMTNEIVSISNPVVARQYQESFQKIVELRKKNNKTRERMIKSGQDTLDQFESIINTICDMLVQRDNILKALISWYSYNFNDFGLKMAEFANEMDETADKFDFEADFKSFVEMKQLVRFDLMDDDDEFQPIDTSGPAFEGVEQIDFPPPIPKVPINIVIAKHTYQAEDEGEISCVKGQYMYMMEDMDYDWVLCMRTGKIGFLPVNCIERVGSKFGVINEDIGMYLKGEYVAVIEENNICYSVINIHGVKQLVEKDFLHVIHSKYTK